MDRHAYHTLQILDHVEKTPLVTNRKVATKLDVSVKLAHALAQAACPEGDAEYPKHHSRRWDYFLTPKGIAEKARLTYQFMDFTMQFYREARRRSSEVLAQARKAGVRRVAFLGVSELAEIAYLGIQEQKLQLVDVFDDARAREKFLGVEGPPAGGDARQRGGENPRHRVRPDAADGGIFPSARRFRPRRTARAGRATIRASSGSSARRRRRPRPPNDLGDARRGAHMSDCQPASMDTVAASAAGRRGSAPRAQHFLPLLQRRRHHRQHGRAGR